MAQFDPTSLAGTPVIGVPDDFRRDLIAMAERRESFAVVLDAITAWQILGAIQLACRHPAFMGSARQTAERFARGLQEIVASTPALARVAEQGWDPEADL
jgi:hypothetical protein